MTDHGEGPAEQRGQLDVLRCRPDRIAGRHVELELGAKGVDGSADGHPESVVLRVVADRFDTESVEGELQPVR